MDSESLKPLLIIGGIGAIAYIMMKDKPATPVVITPPPPAGSGTTPPVVIIPPPVTPPAGGGGGGTPPLTLRQKLLSRVASAGMAPPLNPDQWNYYLHEETGQYANIEGFGDAATRNGMQMGIEQFLAGVTLPAGVSGLGGLGLGWRDRWS